MKWILIALTILFLFGVIGEKDSEDKMIYLGGFAITLTLSVVLHIYG